MQHLLGGLMLSGGVFLAAGLVLPLQGAGGVITDWSGHPLCWKLSEGDVATALKAAPGEVLAAGDAATHAQALRLLAWHQ